MQLRHAPRPLSLARLAIGANRVCITDLTCVTAIRTNVITHARGQMPRSGRRLVRGADQSLMRGQIAAPLRASRERNSRLVTPELRGSLIPHCALHYLAARR